MGCVVFPVVYHTHRSAVDVTSPGASVPRSSAVLAGATPTPAISRYAGVVSRASAPGSIAPLLLAGRSPALLPRRLGRNDPSPLHSGYRIQVSDLFKHVNWDAPTFTLLSQNIARLAPAIVDAPQAVGEGSPRQSPWKTWLAGSWHPVYRLDDGYICHNPSVEQLSSIRMEDLPRDLLIKDIIPLGLSHARATLYVERGFVRFT